MHPDEVDISEFISQGQYVDFQAATIERQRQDEIAITIDIYASRLWFRLSCAL